MKKKKSFKKDQYFGNLGKEGHFELILIQSKW